jgi:NADP-dependent 3-hydroxy acid dehydrogenase YdfG
MMTYDLNDKVVLITGAAGGIGAATARELYALGASLVLTDMQQTAVDQLAKEFSQSRVLPVVPFSVFRGIFGVLTDVVLSRHKEMHALIQQLEAESQR